MPEVTFPSAEVESLGSRPTDLIAAIIARLNDADTFTGVLVRHGLLSQLPTTRERCYFIGVADFSRSPYSGGHRVRDEDFIVRGLIEVHQLGTHDSDVSQVHGRLWQLLDALDAILVADPDLEHAHYTHELLVGGDEVVPMTDGWLARGIFSLGFQATR